MSLHLLKILNLSAKELEVLVANSQEGLAEAESTINGIIYI